MEKILELKDTIGYMESLDYKKRFIAEYWQTKIRYEKLKALLNKWDAYNDYKYHAEPSVRLNGITKELKDFIGFEPTCSYSILETQQSAMGQYLHCLEVRAAIEKIDLYK